MDPERNDCECRGLYLPDRTSNAFTCLQSAWQRHCITSQRTDDLEISMPFALAQLVTTMLVATWSQRANQLLRSRLPLDVCGQMLQLAA